MGNLNGSQADPWSETRPADLVAGEPATEPAQEAAWADGYGEQALGLRSGAVVGR